MTVAGAKDHPITIEPIAGRVRVIWRGRTIGDSARALELSEVGYKPVAYIPREDVDMSLFERTERVTTCPYKGEANYFSLHYGEHPRRQCCVALEMPIAAARRDRLASRLLPEPGRGEARLIPSPSI